MDRGLDIANLEAVKKFAAARIPQIRGFWAANCQASGSGWGRALQRAHTAFYGLACCPWNELLQSLHHWPSPTRHVLLFTVESFSYSGSCCASCRHRAYSQRGWLRGSGRNATIYLFQTFHIREMIPLHDGIRCFVFLPGAPHLPGGHRRQSAAASSISGLAGDKSFLLTNIVAG